MNFETDFKMCFCFFHSTGDCTEIWWCYSGTGTSVLVLHSCQYVGVLCVILPVQQKRVSSDIAVQYLPLCKYNDLKLV